MLGIFEMTELLDVLDDNGFRTGHKLPRKEIHREGHPHRVVHVHVVDLHSNILLQRRSREVDNYPGALTISVAGHVSAGETSMSAALRETEEELSLQSQAINMHFCFSYRRDATLGLDYIDRQFNDVYVCLSKFDLAKITSSSPEVESVVVMPISRFFDSVKDGSGGILDLYRDECRDLEYYLAESRLFRS